MTTLFLLAPLPIALLATGFLRKIPDFVMPHRVPEGFLTALMCAQVAIWVAYAAFVYRIISL